MNSYEVNLIIMALGRVLVDATWNFVRGKINRARSHPSRIIYLSSRHICCIH